MTLKTARNVRLLVLLLLQTPSTAAHILNLSRAEDGIFECESKINLRGPAFASQAKI